MFGSVVQRCQDHREVVTCRDFKERCPTLWSGRNRHGPQIDGGPPLDVGAKDDSRAQAAQLSLVLLVTA
jgi:hypothetical protein